MSEKKMLTLKTSDGQEFEVEEKVAVLSETIRNMVEDDCSSETIPLLNVDARTLSVVIEYCKKHADQDECKEKLKDNEEELKAYEKELKEFDDGLVDEKKDLGLVHDMLLAANYLHIKDLLDVLAQKAANVIKGKSPEEIRQTFGIKNDFSPEEEEEIKRVNDWKFE